MNTGEIEDALAARRRQFLAATAGTLGLGVLGGDSGAAAQPGDTVTVVHDTHFHGRFEDAGDAAKNIGRYGKVVSDLLAANGDGVFLGNGDDLGPSVLGLEFEGAHMVEALNHLKPAAVGAGNHEFDFGVDTATARFQESSFPWVVANLLTPAGDPLPGTERWTTVDVGGTTLGVFGLVVNGFHGITDYPHDYQVLDNVAAAREATTALREDHGADVVVAAAHLDSERQETVAREIDGLDAIVGSHSGVTFDAPKTVGGTVVSEFGDEFDHVGRVTLDVESGDLVDWERVDFYNSDAGGSPPSDGENHRAVDVATTEPDAELQGIADDYLAKLEERLGQPVVETKVELNATFDNYAIETGFGNLLTDIMRGVGDLDRSIDVAVQNAGGIRSDSTYGPGMLTGTDVMNILPFPNEIEVYELTGAQIRSYIGNAISPLPGKYGAQPSIQVSGLSYEWSGHDGEGTVENVFVGGEPLDPGATYLVSTIDFVAARNEEFAEDALVLHTGQFQGPYVKKTLETEYETVAPTREHRMIRVDEDLGEATVNAGDDTNAGVVKISVETTEAIVEPVADTYRVVARTGDVVAADGVTQADGEIAATFDAAALADLAGSIEDPALRLLGEFDPNDEHYGYTDEKGTLLDVPLSSGYENFKLKGAVDAAVLSHGTESAISTETTATEKTETSAGDSAPGFGAAAGAAGAVGGAYLYSKAGDDERDDGPRDG
ncbi:MAG: bifunctional UDP-sugar hydrolase/5'-nucleotidase [Halopenitus sp.]